jgi:hypothetical protein
MSGTKPEQLWQSQCPRRSFALAFLRDSQELEMRSAARIQCAAHMREDVYALKVRS